jgi:hypothetical protein
MRERGEGRGTHASEPEAMLVSPANCGLVASARNVGDGVVSGTPIKHPVSQWGASTCFAAKTIPGFPGILAFDDLAFDNFTIILTVEMPYFPTFQKFACLVVSSDERSYVQEFCSGVLFGSSVLDFCSLLMS